MSKTSLLAQRELMRGFIVNMVEPLSVLDTFVKFDDVEVVRGVRDAWECLDDLALFLFGVTAAEIATADDPEPLPR